MTNTPPKEIVANIKNILPTPHLISESVLVQDAIKLFLSNTNKNLLHDIEEKDERKPASLKEKEIGVVGNILKVQESSQKKDNKEYLSSILEYNDYILEHSFCTMVFSNVSLDLINRLHRNNKKMTINFIDIDIETDPLNFWLSPDYSDEKDNAITYLNAFSALDDLRNRLVKKLNLKNSKNPAETKRAIKRLMPYSYSTTAVISCDMKTWIDLCLGYTSLLADSELRFVFLQLFKILKIRHTNLFYRYVLRDETGVLFRVDTLKFDSPKWRELTVIFK